MFLFFFLTPKELQDKPYEQTIRRIFVLIHFGAFCPCPGDSNMAGPHSVARITLFLFLTVRLQKVNEQRSIHLFQYRDMYAVFIISEF